MLQKVTGWSSGNIHKIVHGFSYRGSSYAGLLEKCPAITFCDRTVVTDEGSSGLSMRRRTNAYTFDHDLYRSWCTGGAVWFDDDEGDGDDTSRTSTDFHHTSTGLEVLKNDAAGPDLPESQYNKNTLVCTGDHFHTSGDTQYPKDEGACVSASLCDPGTVELQHAIPQQKEANDSQSPQSASIALPNAWKSTQAKNDSLEVQGSVSPTPPFPPPPPLPVETRGDHSLRIKARDYTLLDIPEKTPCAVCGGTWSLYVEKLTEERRGRKDQTARRICKRCYQGAKIRVLRVQRQAVILPGAIDVTRMERLKVSVGRCSVCDLDKAAYLDRSTGTSLCESCYQRIARDQGCGEVIG